MEHQDEAYEFPSDSLRPINLDEFEYAAEDVYDDDRYTERWIRSAETSLECLVRFRYVSSIGPLRYGEKPLPGLMTALRESEAVTELQVLALQYPHREAVLGPLHGMAQLFVRHQILPEEVFPLVAELRHAVHCVERVCDDPNCQTLGDCPPPDELRCARAERDASASPLIAECDEIHISRLQFSIATTISDAVNPARAVRKPWPTPSAHEAAKPGTIADLARAARRRAGHSVPSRRSGRCPALPGRVYRVSRTLKVSFY